MTPSYEHSPEHELPPAFVFTLRQPDGREATIDMSTPGGFGDFAFTATVDETRDHFFAYWTAESSIFLDAMKRLKSHSHDEFVKDITHIQSALADMETSGYTPTDEGQGKISEWTVRQRLADSLDSHRYDMFSGGDDALVVNTLLGDGLHIASERNMDGEHVHKEIVIPDSDLWRFVAGMIARSHSDNGSSYTQLTRFSTKQYMGALEMCLADDRG